MVGEGGEMENEIIKVEELAPAEVKEIKEVPSAGEMVEQAFSQAVIATVQNDAKIQNEIMQGAEKVIQNKTSAIKDRAETEATEAHFNSKKSACECFGFNETTTPRSAVSIMGGWHYIATLIWIFTGMFTFAPIVFVFKKISVMIKQTWLAFLISLIIYVALALSPLWIGYIRGL